MMQWLRSLFSRRSPDGEVTRLSRELHRARMDIARIKASYDAAVSNDETIALWSRADNLSARLANSLEVRKQLRQRSRHEAGNGSHMRGITLMLANDLVGTGPSLQILLEDEKACDRIETAWNEWAEEVGLFEKSHLAALAMVVDGEGFGLFINNDSLYSSVKLDLQVLECDYFSTPWSKMQAMDIMVDGIEFDEWQRPKFYHILETHPSEIGWMDRNKFRTEPAEKVLHIFRVDRPGQCRGIPELTPALLIFGHLREYDEAVIRAARIAACLSALIHSKASPDVSSIGLGPFDTTDIEPGMMVNLPEGYEVTQLRPEQPTTTYDSFTLRKLQQACHCCNIPYAIATGDFSKESYAGGRMARQVYHAGISVRRRQLNSKWWDRIFYRWFDEASRIPGLLPDGLSALGRSIPHEWHYDPWESIDETKTSAATTENLANCTTTLAEECAKRKKDWRKVIVQRGRELAMLAEAGVKQSAPPQAPQNTPPEDGETPEEDSTETPSDETPAEEAND